MPDLALLLSVAFNSELRASRLFSRRTGCSPEQALRETLQASAGDGSLAALLDRRQALRAADAARHAARAQQKAAALLLRQGRHEGEMTPWRGWFDGSAHPNPGSCGIGALLKGPAGELVEISRGAGYGNSSEAEYRALVALLETALRLGAHGLTIYGDSKVVIDDLNGSEEAAAMSLKPCRHTALALITQLRDVSLRWIPRHKNAEADALSQRASLPIDLVARNPS
jgi:ribonuclease HI